MSGFIEGDTSSQEVDEIIYSVIIDPKEGYKNEKASYAYEVSGGDRDFVKTLNAENGAWTANSKHAKSYNRCWSWDRLNSGLNPVGGMKCEVWKKHYDYGLCGISDYYKKDIKEDPNFLNWKWQVEACYRIYEDAINRGVIKTTFYGYNHRIERGKFIKFNE